MVRRVTYGDMNKLPKDPFAMARVWKVYAGAGCGKTKSISDTIEFLMEEKGVRADEIMYVLFNKKPAEAFRAKWKIKADDMKWWGTHHAIAKRLLKLSNDKILDIEKWGAEHGFDLHNDPFTADGGFDVFGWDATFASLQKKIYLCDENLDSQERRLLEALQKTEEETGEFCHIRYLQRSIHMRLFPPGVRFVFADEAQDNGPLQYRWFDQIIKNRFIEGIMLAGDDKQAINEFKGSRPLLFLDFKADQEVHLLETWRCSENILKEANHIVHPIKKRSPLTEKSMTLHPGRVLYEASFEDVVPDIIKYLREDKEIMILARNRCFLTRVETILHENGILSENEWSLRLRNTVNGLIQIRKEGGVRQETLSAILPDASPKRGQLKKLSYWEKGVVDKLRTGEGLAADPDLYAAYGDIRFGRTIPLAEIETLGFKREFMNDMALWKIPDEKWFLSTDFLQAFKETVRIFGWKAPTVRLSTIHSIKGEEADVVILLTDITDSVRTAEWNDEEAERRVWYVGETRARDTLILTSLSFKNNSVIL